MSPISSRKLSLVVLMAALVLAFSAGADTAGQDRSAILYSTKIAFTDKKIPIVTVAIVDDTAEATFSSKAPLSFFVDKAAGPVTTVPAGTWTATVEDTTPAVLEYWVVLARTTTGTLDDVYATKATWEQEGLKVRLFEVGGVFGFYGRLFDNREMLVVLDEPKATKDEAKAAITELQATHPDAEFHIHMRPKTKATGTVVVSSSAGTFEISSKDVLYVEAEGGAPITVEDIPYGKGFTWGGKEDRTYGGILYFAVDRHGTLAVVNEMSIETMLEGVVPAEIFASAPLESLKAQAVCARGTVLAKLGKRHLADPYQLCASIHCQAYAGLKKVDKRTTKAVWETAGQLLFHDDELVDTVYHANSGGFTEHNENVWDSPAAAYLRGGFDGPSPIPEQYVGGINDANIEAWLTDPPKTYPSVSGYGSKQYRWEKLKTVPDLTSSLKDYAEVGMVKDLKVLFRGVSGRATQVEITGDQGVAVLTGELTIRKALGGLPSSMFIVSKDEQGSFIFKGGGFGHGVGMSQVGAIGMAKEGKTYKEILEHYFQDSQVDTIY